MDRLTAERHERAPAPAGEALLDIRGLSKTFGGNAPRTLFSAVDLQLHAGEFIAVMGESGSGKSTLLNLIAGLEPADAGRILLGGEDIVAMNEDDRARLRRTRLGFVFQAFHLLPYASVEDNVALPLLLTGCPRGERAERVLRALEDVGLAQRRASMPHELSGGEMQRVAIARALVHAPALVLADEPTGSLDAALAGDVLALLRRCVERSRAACILVTHSPNAAAVADRVYVLDAAGLSLRPAP